MRPARGLHVISGGGVGRARYVSSILFGDTMVPVIELDYILLLGYHILYKEYNLTRFNHNKTLLTWCSEAEASTIAILRGPVRIILVY